MDALLNLGNQWIVVFQSWGAWLAAPMKFFSFLGSEEFFILLLPALYWCVDAGLGLRVGVILLFSGALNDHLKLLFHWPRPYWYSDQVRAYAAEGSFGLPSGHAQLAVGVWGTIANHLRRAWAWSAAIALMLLIGFSRMFLGVHFPSDVIAGWVIGALILGLFLRYWDALAAWLKKFSVGQKIGMAFTLSLILIAIGGVSVLSLQAWRMPPAWLDNAALAGDDPPAPVSLDGSITSAATLFGLLAGVAWLSARGRYDAGGSAGKRLGRYAIGLIGVLILWFGLGQIFPRGEALIPYLLRYLRYALIGSWVAAGAPLLFVRLKLAAPLQK